MQIFRNYHLIFADNFMRNLMQTIFFDICNFFMKPCSPYSLFISVYVQRCVFASFFSHLYKVFGFLYFCHYMWYTNLLDLNSYQLFYPPVKVLYILLSQEQVYNIFHLVSVKLLQILFSLWTFCVSLLLSVLALAVWYYLRIFLYCC